MFKYIKHYVGEAVKTTVANFLAVCFYLFLHLRYNIKVQGIANYSASPSTLITVNHKRDIDIPLIGPTLHLSRTLFKERLRLHFVARNDLFDPGFLTAHFNLFLPFGRLIHRVNLSPLMRAFRAHGINHLLYIRAGPLLRRVLQLKGDVKLKEAVKPQYIRAFAEELGIGDEANLGEISLSNFLGYKYRRLHQQPIDIGILKDGLPKMVRSSLLTTIGNQLKNFADILDQGSICLLAPEGHLSPDGRFWRIKSGLHRLVSLTRSRVRILPVNTTYDFMTKGRMRIYLTIGEELHVTKELKKAELEKLVQESILKLAPITTGQLGSEYILKSLKDGREVIEESEFYQAMVKRANELKDEGFRLEQRMLTSMQKRFHDFIRFCQDKSIISRKPNGNLLINRKAVTDTKGSDHWQNPVVYSANELESRLELAAR